MAERKMRESAEDLRVKGGVTRVAMLHRTGVLAIGEASVGIAVSSPHRREAFTACQYAIDRLKQTVPIWKKEVWSNGEQWIGWEGGAAAEGGPAAESEDQGTVESHGTRASLAQPRIRWEENCWALLIL